MSLSGRGRYNKSLCLQTKVQTYQVHKEGALGAPGPEKRISSHPLFSESPLAFHLSLSPYPLSLIPPSHLLGV